MSPSLVLTAEVKCSSRNIALKTAREGGKNRTHGSVSIFFKRLLKNCFKFCILEQIIATVLFICISSINKKDRCSDFNQQRPPLTEGGLPVVTTTTPYKNIKRITAIPIRHLQLENQINYQLALAMSIGNIACGQAQNSPHPTPPLTACSKATNVVPRVLSYLSLGIWLKGYNTRFAYHKQFEQLCMNRHLYGKLARNTNGFMLLTWTTKKFQRRPLTNVTKFGKSHEPIITIRTHCFKSKLTDQDL